LRYNTNMTWKYSTDNVNGRYTINWSPSAHGTPYVNSVEQIDVGDLSFQDVTFVYDAFKYTAYISAVIKNKVSLETYDIPTFMVSEAFLYDMGLSCTDRTPKDDKFIKKLVLILDKTGFWTSPSTKQNMKKKPIKSYNVKDLEYDPKIMSTYMYDPMGVESNSKLKNEIKQKDALIAELKEQIQEMKDEIEMLKAINLEC